MTSTGTPHPKERDPAAVQAMFASISTRYDTANLLLSNGMDAWWRRITAREVARHQPSSILDIATGSGVLMLALKKWNPQAGISGVDFCLPMLQQAAAKGIGRLAVGDGLQLPVADASFDAATVAFGLRNMADWGRGLREMSRVLVAGGHAYVLDFSMPGRLLAPFYRTYLHHVLPKAAGWITGERDAYQYLAASIEEFPKGKVMVDLMLANGFCEAMCTPLTGGIVSLYCGRKAG